MRTGMRQIILHEPVRIAGTVAALVVPAHNLGNLWPGELHAADDLVADDGVIGHFTKFFGIERRGLAEEAAIDGDFSNVVQISRAAQRRHVARLHAHGLADGRGVAAYAQRVSMNVYVLDVDGGGKGFERVVVETMQRGREPQIFGDALRDALGQRVILNRERDVAAEQFEGVEFVVFVERIAGTASESDHSRQLSSRFQGSEAFEQFRCDVAVGTQEHRIGRRVQHDGTTRRSERMHMFGKERNEGGIRHQGESQRRGGGQHGGLVVEQQEHAFARARRFHDGRQHEARSFREVALRRKRGPELGKRLNCVQQPP